MTPRQKWSMCLTLLLPGMVMAEGAVRVLDCESIRQCDAAGQCEAHQETVEFRMQPQAVDADGAGEFTVQFRGSEVAMRSLSDIGPFIWTQNHQRFTLLASSETEFVLHVLSLAAEPSATLQFLRCTFRQ